MKRIAFIFTFAFALLVVGCKIEKDIDNPAFKNKDGNGEIKGLEFVHFSAAKESWLVTKDDESFEHNVVVGSTYAHGEDVTYNISLDKTNGTEGKEFSIPVKSVTIKAGEYSAAMPITINYDNIEKDQTFYMELSLAVDDALINPVYGRKAVITVLSDKITIDWGWLLGNWTAQDLEGDPYTMSVAQVDETTATFTNIWGMESDMTGTVDFDKNLITFQGPINLGELYGGNLMIAHYNEEIEDYDDGVFYGEMSALGIRIFGHGYYLVGGSYDGYDFGEDITMMTR